MSNALTPDEQAVLAESQAGWLHGWQRPEDCAYRRVARLVPGNRMALRSRQARGAAGGCGD